MKDLKNKLRKYGIPVLLCISLICNIFSIQQVVEFNNQVIELNDWYDKLNKENSKNLDIIDELRNEKSALSIKNDHYVEANKSLHKSIDELKEEIETIKSENEEKINSKDEEIADLNKKIQEYKEELASVDDTSSYSSGSKGSNSSVDEEDDDDSYYSGGGDVYITEHGDKYHLAGCKYLRKSQIPISRSDARAQGYTPCKICKPG